MNPNEAIRRSFADWFYGSSQGSKDFKRVLLEVSKKMKSKGRGFVTVEFKTYDDYLIFVGDRSKAKVSYRVIKQDKVPLVFQEKFKTADLTKQFLMYSTFGTGLGELTLMDVITI